MGGGSEMALRLLHSSVARAVARQDFKAANFLLRSNTRAASLMFIQGGEIKLRAPNEFADAHDKLWLSFFESQAEKLESEAKDLVLENAGHDATKPSDRKKFGLTGLLKAAKRYAPFKKSV